MARGIQIRIFIIEENQWREQRQKRMPAEIRMNNLISYDYIKSCAIHSMFYIYA